MRTIHGAASDAGADTPPELTAAAESRASGPPGAQNASPIVDRRVLAEEVYAEMAAWPARDRFGAFRKWHQGALSLIHLNVLTVLEAEGPLPMHRLAETLDVSDGSLTGIVDRMERRGLVERQHDAEDRRLVLVHPTGAGEGVFKEMQAHRLERLRVMLDLLGDDELASLLTGIRGLHRAAAEMRLMHADEPVTAASDSDACAREGQPAQPAPEPSV